MLKLEHQQDPHEVRMLLQKLDAASRGPKSGRRTFSCKRTTFQVEGSKNIKVDSWRFRDWDYKRDDLPTYARGLFTTTTSKNIPEIAVRGYDKFFNVDEVKLTKWENIEKNTRGPYELSVKENGCIIFMSGLEDGTLLVCSKHSTGPREDAALSHASAGQRWVRRHLESVGKTEQELAKRLREMNATAVGELCDDSFEEHVLPYPEEDAGIYLHGINFNLPEFATLPSSEVHKFADEWGFRKAQFVLKDDIFSVKSFLEECAETGSWNGRDTEGFVIRCKMREHPQAPYVDWFFKYKFEEPYLMYRQWREATKAIIAGKPPKIKKHVKITEQYLQYARRRLAQDPKLGKLYNQNHGIIDMRNGFLNQIGLRGSDIIRMEVSQGDVAPVEGNVVLVPIASIGCGKTTVALGLVKLFRWGHVQNDNIQGKKDRPRRFAQEIVSSLAKNKVVIADRNNHQRREREQIIRDVRAAVPEARFVALHYVHEPKGQLLDGIREVTRQRVLDRGDNHQTIRAGSKSPEEIIGIMEGFLHRFEGADPERAPDDDFDEIIDLEVAASSRENLETVVNVLRSNYPKLFDSEAPTPEDLDNAIDAAMRDYTVETKHDLNFGRQKGSKQSKADQNQAPIMSQDSPDRLAKRSEYFCISIDSFQVTTLLSSLFPTSTPPEKAKLYNHLRNSRRIQPTFHVTLIHKALAKDRADVWSRYIDLYNDALNKRPDGDSNPTPPLGKARVRLERLIWDDRVMAFVARIQPLDEGAEWPCVNEVPHVTIGTASPAIKPKESNDLLKRWLEVGSTPETGIWEAEVPGVKVLDGTVSVVLSRK
ncbi:hypothetical protein VTO42DRAFT_4196 [Malbranchea cinnamomea]